MHFKETKLKGAYEIYMEPIYDERGYFAMTFCVPQFEDHGLETEFVQSNVAFNAQRGTLRGMHYQAEPHPEIKLVRCTRGIVYDVIIDLRPKSETYCQWHGVYLADDSTTMLYVPEGFAHGYMTLEDDTEVSYQMSESYRKHLERGVLYDDPVFGIHWPIREPKVISQRDLNHPLFGKEFNGE